MKLVTINNKKRRTKSILDRWKPLSMCNLFCKDKLKSSKVQKMLPVDIEVMF